MARCTLDLMEISMGFAGIGRTACAKHAPVTGSRAPLLAHILGNLVIDEVMSNRGLWSIVYLQRHANDRGLIWPHSPRDVAHT